MLKVQKTLNNNVVVAEHPDHEEVILIGKGLGFNRSSGDFIADEHAEKFFVLKDKEEQNQYVKLLDFVDESFVGIMNEFVEKLEDRFQAKVNEHIHVGLTDHLYFTLRRIEQGHGIKNPFLKETELAYPKEFAAASALTEWLNEQLNVRIPEGEIGFIALHIHSAVTNRNLNEINQHTQLVSELIEMIETHLYLTIDRQDGNYLRLVRHLHHAVERIRNENYVENHDSLKTVLQSEYPVCYSLAWKLMKVMQQRLKTAIPESEAVYLTLHLQRLEDNVRTSS